LNPIKTNTVVPNPIDYIKRLPTPNTKKNFYSAFMKFIELSFSIKFETDKDRRKKWSQGCHGPSDWVYENGAAQSFGGKLNILVGSLNHRK
jgi:hypothetical protein